MSFKTTFAAQIGLSVANIRLRDALRAQSMRDPLTGLYNRRYLTEMLEREIRRAARAEQSLGIMMLDLDHLKKFNDTYGHEAGDGCCAKPRLFWFAASVPKISSAATEAKNLWSSSPPPICGLPDFAPRPFALGFVNLSWCTKATRLEW